MAYRCARARRRAPRHGILRRHGNATPVNNPDDPELTNQRLGLISAARVTLHNALSLLGVTAPERM